LEKTPAPFRPTSTGLGVYAGKACSNCGHALIHRSA
jgi:hypothetical protein